MKNNETNFARLALKETAIIMLVLLLGGAIGVGLEQLFTPPVEAQTIPQASGIYSYVPSALNGGSNSIGGNATMTFFTNNAGNTNVMVSNPVSDYDWIGVWAGFNFITNGGGTVNASNKVTFNFVWTGDGATYDTTNNPIYSFSLLGTGNTNVFGHTNFFAPTEGSLQLLSVVCAGTNTATVLSNLNLYFSYKAHRIGTSRAN